MKSARYTVLEIQIRVGLNAGEVVVRAIGNDLHMDYSAIGQTTHLAARMEQLATPGSILLPAATLYLVEGLVQVNAMGAVAVRGLTEPVEVFELVGAAAVRPWSRVAVTQGFTRFVGRHVEMQALGEALARAGDGHGQLVAVSGEPGMGKSRLLYEFSNGSLTEGWHVLETGAVSYGQATPYLPIRDLLRAYFQIDDQDDERKIQEKVDKRLTWDEALQETRPDGAGVVGRGRRRPRVAGPRSAATPPAHHRRRQAPAAAGESGATAPGAHREPALDRCWDAGCAR